MLAVQLISSLPICERLGRDGSHLYSSIDKITVVKIRQCTFYTKYFNNK